MDWINPIGACCFRITPPEARFWSKPSQLSLYKGSHKWFKCRTPALLTGKCTMYINRHKKFPRKLKSFKIHLIKKQIIGKKKKSMMDAVSGLSEWSASPAVYNYRSVSRLLLLPLHGRNDVNHPPSVDRYSDLRPSVEVEVAYMLWLLFLDKLEHVRAKKMKKKISWDWELCDKKGPKKEECWSDMLAYLWITHWFVGEQHVFTSEGFALRFSSQLHSVISKYYAALWWPILEALFLVAKVRKIKISHIFLYQFWSN